MDPVASLPAPKPPLLQPSSKAAVEQFESVLIGELTGYMLSTVDTDSAFGGGHAEEIYRGMLTEHLGNAVAKRGGLSLSSALMAEVVRLQGASR